MKEKKRILKRIRQLVIIFITLLVLSGVTAFPLQTELNYLVDVLNANENSGLISTWIFEVSTAINETAFSYPFLSYGTDWLAFSHIIISIFFIGVYIDPVRNIWSTYTGIIACLLVFPLAFIAGYAREIPIFWQLIDCSFGALGLIPLILIHKYTKQIEFNTYPNK